MNLSYTLKNLLTSLQGLIRPMLFISLALHGLLLLIPMPNKNIVDVRKKEVEKSVKVTQLPTTVPLPTTKPSFQVSPKAPTPKPTPRQVVTPVTRQPVLPVRPQLSIQASPRPKPVQASLSPSPAPSPEVTTSPIPSPEPTPVTSTALVEFPIFPGAKAGCLEVQSCFQTGNPLDNVAAYFEKELQARGFTASADVDELNSRKVYQVSRSDFPTQYLSLISTEQGTIYVLAEEPRNLNELKNAVVVPPEFYNILAEVGEDIEDETVFANPNDFFSKLSSQDPEGSVIPPERREEIQGMKLVSGQPSDAVYASMLPSLQSIFEVSKSDNYSSGLLYKLKKSSFTGYLNLVPTKDGTGTIVVLWAEPRS